MLAFVRRARVACRRDRIWALGAVLLGLVSDGCGFPKYSFELGAGGSSGVGGAAADGGFSGSNSGAGGEGGAADSGSSGMAGSGATAGVGGALPACAVGGSSGAPTLANHCTNGKKDGDETGPDCGGRACRTCFHTEGCQHDTDCISNVCTAASTCAPLFDLQFKAVIADRNTNTLEFELRLSYLGMPPLSLNTVVLRYYFARGDVADPIVPFATEALLNGSLSLAPQTQWKIVRVLPDPAALADTYLEIGFTGSRTLIQGDVVELSQSIQNGSAAGRLFDQFTHYSFQNTSVYAPEEKVAVYRQGKLSWGTPPPYTQPQQCFFTAVNFAGEAFSAAGLDYVAGTPPLVQFDGTVMHDASPLVPAPDPAYVPLLQSALVLDSAPATLSVPNGAYWVYPYLVTGNGANVADLLIQGAPATSFAAESIAGGAAWARVGPYSATVTQNKLVLAASGGALRIAGIELYAAAP